MDEAVKLKLLKLVKELEKYRGRHTELITIYVPAGYSMILIAKQVDSEKSTAQNIKSKQTKKNVLDALERITRHLKLFKETPPNGLAIFCGNVSETEGQENIEIWGIEPPKPLKTKLYRCDQTFVIEPLKEMLEISEVYGLVVMERKEATLGLLEGKSIRVLRRLTSGIPGKFKTGGQSAQRFHRILEGMSKEFYKRIGEAMKTEFFGMSKLKGILIGGPVPTKEDFIQQGDLATALKEKIISVRDIGYADEHGLKLLVDASKDVLAEQEFTQEKKILDRFFTLLATKPNIVSYGLDEVRKALKMGAVEELLLSSSVDEKIFDELEEIAISTSSVIKIISEQTDEGVQFRNIGGIGAVLRYPIQ